MKPTFPPQASHQVRRPEGGKDRTRSEAQLPITLHEAGGLVVGGTDCGGLSYPPPGFALLREIELLAEAIGSMAAIRAVTSVAARYLRQQDNLGSVAPGHYADLLIVDCDPIGDVRELRKLKTVYRGGVAYDPKARLAQVPQRDIKYAA